MRVATSTHLPPTFGFSTSSATPSPMIFSIDFSSSITKESRPSFSSSSAQRERWRGTSQKYPSCQSCQHTVMYGEPFGWRQAIRITRPCARNASRSSLAIRPSLPLQVVSAIPVKQIIAPAMEPMSELAMHGAEGNAATPFAASLAHVPYSRIREIGEIAMSMDGVLRLYFGESNLPTPAFITDAAVRALREGYTFYSENAGLPALRREIADQYRRLHAVELDPGCEIVITASGVHALHLAIRSVIDPGDEAVILSPAWPNSTSIVALSHGVPIDVPLTLAGERYRIDFAALEAALSPRTRLIVLTSPSNPLGWVAGLDEQRRLLELCRDRGIWLLADEVYERIYYSGGEIDTPAPSILR